VAKAGLEENVVFAPGRAFSPSPQWRDYMRFNPSSPIRGWKTGFCDFLRALSN
jgi:DNA-binding transcriptional MocR family regulator